MKSAFKFEVKGWKKFLVATNPLQFGEAYKRALRKATEQNGAMAKDTMRRTIMRGMAPGNAELTQAIKGFNRPLYDSGALADAADSKVVSDTEAFVGIPRDSPRYNVAVIVHEGATIRVTPAMRAMFDMLARASAGDIDPSALTGRAAELWGRSQDWRPLADSTSVIVIPARRFADATFEDVMLKSTARRNWEAATAAAFKERVNAWRGKD